MRKQMAKVLLKCSSNILKEIKLDEKDLFKIGRAVDNEIHIDDDTVSSCHAGIEKQENRFYIEDLNSLNGTYVNKQRISEKVLLNHGDTIYIGRHVLNFVSEEIQIQDKPEEAEFWQEDDLNRDKRELEEQKPEKQYEGSTGGLVVLEGSLDQKEYSLNRKVISIGKDKSAGIRLKGLFLPDFVAFINKNKRGYSISPVSGNKLAKVNGKLLKGRYQLQEGDIIKIGSITLQFYME